MANVASDRRNMVGTEAHSDAPLVILERLLPSQEIDSDGGCDAGVKEIAPFLMLPRLRKCHVMKLMAAEDDHMHRLLPGQMLSGHQLSRSPGPFAWSGPPTAPLESAMSNIRALHLEGCCIDAVNIGRILGRMPSLISLKYSHHATWEGCGHNWDAGDFATAVSRRCDSQLTQLSLTVRHRMGFIKNGISSLRGFKALKEVQLDLLMFAAPPTWSGLRSGFRALNLGADAGWNISSIPPLAQILPFGTERVSLVMHAGYGIDHGQSELERVRKQLQTLKALFATDVKLSHPCLQQIILRHDGRMIDLGMHTTVGQSGERADVLLESQVAGRPIIESNRVGRRGNG